MTTRKDLLLTSNQPTYCDATGTELDGTPDGAVYAHVRESEAIAVGLGVVTEAGQCRWACMEVWMEWMIEPYKGLGPLRFGMSRAEVASILDPLAPLHSTTPAYGGGTQELRRLDLPICTYGARGLSNLHATPHVNGMVYRDLHPFLVSPRLALQQLERWNGNARIEFDMVLFETLGLILTEFYREREAVFAATDGSEQDDRTVSLFAAGSQDLLQKEARPITFL